MTAARTRLPKHPLYQLGVTLFAAGIAFAQAEKLPSGTITSRRITSAFLQEQRTVSLFLPASYESSDASYPLLIVLDGEDFFLFTAGMVSYYAAIGGCPEFIVAGIDAGDRWRDYTPTNAPIPDGTPLPSSGGGDTYSAFLREEVVPELSSAYRLTPFRVLCGHSIAGLFTVDAFLAEPRFFSGYIATSPSLWWDGELMTARVQTIAGDTQFQARSLFFTIGNEGPTMEDPILRFKASLEEIQPSGIDWQFRKFEGVDHQTMPLKAFLYGLEYICRDWRLPADSAEAGLAAVLDYYDSLSRRYKQIITPPESTLNGLGYAALRRGDITGALEIFRRNAALYSQSANVFDSLGEACLAAGDTAAAIRNYRTSLQLNPDNGNAADVLEALTAIR